MIVHAFSNCLSINKKMDYKNLEHENKTYITLVQCPTDWSNLVNIKQYKDIITHSAARTATIIAWSVARS